MARVFVIKPGMLTTVQARPRVGWQHLGVPPGGAMDERSFRVANLLVGNESDEAALEITLVGPELEFDAPATVAVAGADLSAQVDGAELPLMTATPVGTGSRIRFGTRRAATRAYLAVRGGLDAPLVLGSRATSLSGALPGLSGRALRAGDELPIADRATRKPPNTHATTWPRLRSSASVRVIPGPDVDLFSDETLEAFERAEYRISPRSNRMGYRLEGPALKATNAGTLLSEATPIGSIQVPPSGLPILLMADRQTTGGYPRIGTVITADLPIAGQLAPGDTLRFARCSRSVAIDALRESLLMIEWLRSVS